MHDNYITILKDRYVLVERIGEGGMGVVYKAKDLLMVEAQHSDPYVAIKLLSEEFKTHPQAFISFHREFNRTQRLTHPNIINIYGFDKDGDTAFITMEYLEGKPLDKIIRQYHSGLPEEEAFKIVRDISTGLTYAHEKKIIHSDIKPANLFVLENGRTKILDFGLARAVAKIEYGADGTTVFDAGSLGALTPTYASLEMLEGEHPDAKDDIYAIGCIVYQLYSGQHPFNRVPADEAYRHKLEPKKISKLTSRQWESLLQALAFRREKRIKSIDHFWNKFSSKALININVDLSKYNLDILNYAFKSDDREKNTRYKNNPKMESASSEERLNSQKLDTQNYRYVATKRQSSEHASSEDRLNRKKLIETLASFLAEPENTHHQTVGLLGDWGIGKSSAIEVLKETIVNQHTTQPFLFAHFSAWEYEHSDNIQAGIAQEAIKVLSSTLPRRFNFSRRNKKV